MLKSLKSTAFNFRRPSVSSSYSESHWLNRWRLQKAFYSEEGAGTLGCGGITTADCFMTIPDYNKLSLDPDGPLTLADLAGMKPEYICNTVVNSWQRNPGDDPYELFTISPVRIERLDCDPGMDELDSLSPRDIRLSEAMATSAAVVSRHMGAYEGQMEAVQDLQNVLGIAMGAEVLSDPRSVERDSICLQVRATQFNPFTPRLRGKFLPFLK